VETRINEAELSLLAYLHENAEGYGESFCIETEKAATELNLGVNEFWRVASYLSGWGLMGISDVTGGPTYGPVTTMSPIYLTSAGEAYMREVDERAAASGIAERGKRLGVASVKALGQGLLKIASDVLTDLAMKAMRGT
jgi:hypothetical protein